jgi:hypothetical protein
VSTTVTVSSRYTSWGDLNVYSWRTNTDELLAALEVQTSEKTRLTITCEDPEHFDALAQGFAAAAARLRAGQVAGHELVASWGTSPHR